MMTLGQRLEERFLHTLVTYNGANLEKSAKHNHIEHLRVLHLGSLVHSIDAIDGDILSRRRIDDSKAVVDEYSTRFDFRFKLVE